MLQNSPETYQMVRNSFRWYQLFLNSTDIAELYQLVANDTKQHPTKPNSAEHYRMVQNVAKRYGSVSKEGYQTVLNSAERFRMEPVLYGAERC